jgi:hypothetical protein
MAKKSNQWIAICSFPHPQGTKPYVMQDDELENVALFASPEAIKKVADRHMLSAGDWYAFNFETGETVMVN